MTTFQVKILNTRTGGTLVCGVTAESREAVYRTLGYLPGSGWGLVITGIEPIPPRSER